MAKRNFTMTLKGGGFRTGSSLRSLVERDAQLERAGAKATHVLKAHTPVKTGNLRGRWGFKGAGKSWQGNTVTMDVVNTANYAERVNTRGRSRGYADRGIEAAQNTVKQELKAGAASIVADLWDKGEGRGRPR